MDHYERLVRQYAHAEQLRKVFIASENAGGAFMTENQITKYLSEEQRRIMRIDKGWTGAYRSKGVIAPFWYVSKGPRVAAKSRVNQMFFRAYSREGVEAAVRDQAFHLCMRTAHNDWVWDEAPYKKGSVDIVKKLVNLEYRVCHTRGAFPGLSAEYPLVREALAERIAIMTENEPYMPRMPE